MWHGQVDGAVTVVHPDFSQRRQRAQGDVPIAIFYPQVPGDPGYCTSPAANVSQPALTPTKGSFNITSASLGAKVRVSDKFVFFGNVLIKLDDGGLRARVVPLVGASFSF